ncbi:LysR family transcriptional regulator [Roseobacter sp. AzwK-3b]|uniref:LysR family transcriptional regulator n=1 Tax=Roseobacter sp. AzwK-3b TaxID=351016 RepID=UPI0018DC774E|nr:LysR family transcriptional regulator [Roseobacter sp. AzwK-3b]
MMNTYRRSELGLLVVLVAIADTGSVSAAAERMSLSQPTVSHALRRLRDITGDQLFELIGRQMVPTAVATQMIDEARLVVEGANALLRPRAFDPTANSPTWKIGVSDYSLLALGAQILDRLSAINQAARIEFTPLGPHTLDDLLALKTDFAFYGDIVDPRISPPIVAVELFKDKYVGVMCRSHPLAKTTRSDAISLDDWLQYNHIGFTSATPGVSSINQALLKLGLKRTIGLTSPSHQMNLKLLSGTTMLLCLPERLVHLVNKKAFITFHLPIHVEPYPYYILHHERLYANPALQFMRDIIHDVCDHNLSSELEPITNPDNS